MMKSGSPPPLFTVIIPTYNRASLLDAAIKSVLAQSETDYELIVVDDGSTDDTHLIFERYSSRLRVLRQHNSGPSAARNHGIQQATGEYLAFLDSDDMWFPWTLETYRKAIERYHRPNGLLGVAAEFSQPEEVSNVRAADFDAIEYPDLFSTSDKDVWLATPVSIIRRDAVKRVGGFRAATECFEDLDLWLRLGIDPTFVRIKQPMTLAYRRHAGGVSLRAGKCVAGATAIWRSEKRHEYPGGIRRSRERRQMIGRLQRAMAVGLTRRRWLRHGLRLYIQSWSQQARLMKVKYLMGYPVVFILALFRGGPRVGGE